MNRFLTVSGLVVGLAGPASLAQDPAQLTPVSNPHRRPMSARAEAPFVGPQGVVLMDQHFIVDGLLYTMANGNANAGGGIYGTLYDLEMCDEFTSSSDFEITGVSVDSISFLGANAEDGLDVGLFADLGGEPDNEAYYDQIWLPAIANQFTDPIFGLFGLRFSATGNTGPVPAGTWFLRVKPCDFSMTGDWYYCPVADVDTGYDAFLRDGDNGEPGYGFTEWRSTCDYSDCGDMSIGATGNLIGGEFMIALQGECPGRMTLTATGATPGRPVAFAYSDRLGDWTVPGVCSGTVLGIVSPTVFEITRADESGQVSISRNVPPSFCGNYYLQAVDVRTCTPSNIIEL